MTDAPHVPSHGGGNLLTKQAGALPVYGWVGVGIAGIVLGTWAKKRFAANSALPAAAAAPTDPNAPDPTQGAVEVQVSPMTTDPASTPQNNADWRVAAERKLIEEGKNPLTVMSAIGKYLSSAPDNLVSQAEAGLIQEALRVLGPPPDGADPINIAPAPASVPVSNGTPSPATPPSGTVVQHQPAPAPKPVPAAPQHHASTVTVQSGDTLWALASRAYGSGGLYPRIYSANASTIEAAAHAHGRSSSENGHWIYPGTVLVIP